mmetsp:Transcript_26292/g.40337  ORF Transcript_26292/g.40337 Transcript_26292/m.40337 type:complete len:98 (+) Transcript_26292:1-294(+)
MEVSDGENEGTAAVAAGQQTEGESSSYGTAAGESGKEKPSSSWNNSKKSPSELKTDPSARSTAGLIPQPGGGSSREPIAHKTFFNAFHDDFGPPTFS